MKIREILIEKVSQEIWLGRLKILIVPVIFLVLPLLAVSLPKSPNPEAEAEAFRPPRRHEDETKTGRLAVDLQLDCQEGRTA